MSVTTWQGMLNDMYYYDVDHGLLWFGIGSGSVQPLTNFTWMSCDGLTIGLIVMGVQVVMSTYGAILMMTLEREDH